MHLTFQEAERLGIRRTVHAGENGSARNVQEVSASHMSARGQCEPHVGKRSMWVTCRARGRCEPHVGQEVSMSHMSVHMHILVLLRRSPLYQFHGVFSNYICKGQSLSSCTWIDATEINAAQSLHVFIHTYSIMVMCIWCVYQALDEMHAERIGHGYNCLEDAALYRSILERRVHLEACPMSSFITGSVPLSFKEHPIHKLVLCHQEILSNQRYDLSNNITSSF